MPCGENLARYAESHLQEHLQRPCGVSPFRHRTPETDAPKIYALLMSLASGQGFVDDLEPCALVEQEDKQSTVAPTWHAQEHATAFDL